MTSYAASYAPAGTAARSAWLDGGARTLLLAVLVAAPLPLGCAADGPRAWLTAALGAVALVVFGAALLRGRRPALPTGTLPLAAFAVVPLLQLLPVAVAAPPGLLGDHTPDHLSLVPVRTLARCGELLALFVTFAAAASAVDGPRAARTVLGTLLGLAAVLVVHGVLAWRGVVPLLDPEQAREVMVGTFVNRNHLANLLAIAAIGGAGLFASLRHRRAPAGALALVATGIVTAVLGIVATESRGGLLALGVGCLAFPLLALQHRGTVRALAAVGVVGVLALGCWLLPNGYVHRFASVGHELQSAGTRTDIWRGALGLWRAFPWLGTGLGTYGDVSPATQTDAVPGRVEHAHADPLELLVETGAVGALLLAGAVGWFGVRTVRRCRSHTDRERALLAASGLAALAATLAHSCVEFHLQIPANAAWAAALAGLVVGVLRSRREAPAPARHGVLLAAVALAAAGLGMHRVATHTAADGLAAIARGQALLASDPAAAGAEARAALAQNPFSPRAHRLAGAAALGADPAAAEREFAASLRWVNPAERPRHTLEVAVSCLAAGDLEQCRRWLAATLPGRDQDALREGLAALLDALPSADVLLPLLPAEPAAVRAAFAEVLAHRGDFAGRELVLADLRGGAPVLLTVADGVQLVAAAAPTTATGANGTELAVALDFVRAPHSAPAQLVLHVEAPGAALYRSFATDTDAYRYLARLDPTFPPGEYLLSLDVRRDLPLFPFARAIVAGSDLDAAARVVPATELYWSTGEPGRRQRLANGLPLRAGDVAFRRLVWPAGDHDLVVRTQSPTRLSVRCGDLALAPANAESATVHRFPLPSASPGAAPAGLVSIAAALRDDPVLRDLTIVPRSSR